MRLCAIKHLKHETVIYNPAIFVENEDLIIFPFQEFDKFYNETVQSLNVVKNLIIDSINPELNTDPKQDLEHIIDWINLIQDDMDLLLKFDVQTSLKSFNNTLKKSKAQKVNKIAHVEKEEIQCLIGIQ